MKKNRKKIFTLSIIILISFFVRIVNLNTNPPSLHADEADTVYSANSLLKTGKDAYGNPWPLHFKAQSDVFRAPIYTYTTIIPVALFGMNAFSARINSVIAGIVCIIALYFLTRYYTKSDNLALLTAALAAINPWLIHISRTGLEIQMSLTFVILGILFFHKAMLGKTNVLLILSSVFFGLSIHTYNAPKVFVPLILLILFVYNKNLVFKRKISIFIFLLIFCFFYSVMGYLALFENGAAELERVGIFDESTAAHIVNSERTNTNAPLPISSIFSNKVVFYGREFMNKYSGPLSPSYLFLNGDSSLDKGIGTYGQFHFFEIIPFFAGIYFLFRKNRKVALFLFAWFAAALVPGGITKSGYYSYRDVNLSPVILMFNGIGMWGIYSYLKNGLKIRQSFIYLGLLVIVLLTSIYFIYIYFYSYPVFSRDWWGWNQKQAILFGEKNKTDYDGLLIQGGTDWDILYAYYAKTDPEVFQAAYQDKIGENNNFISIHNVHIGSVIDKNKIAIQEKIEGNKFLLVVPGNVLEDVPSKKRFYGIDGVHVELKTYDVINGEIINESARDE